MKNNKFNNFEILIIYKYLKVKDKACEYSQMGVSYSLSIKPYVKKRFITFASLFLLCIYEKTVADCGYDVACYAFFRSARKH